MLNNLVTDKSIKIGTFTCEQWLTDLRSKLEVVLNDAKVKELKALEKTLEDLLSTDAKVSLQLESLTNSLATL